MTSLSFHSFTRISKLNISRRLFSALGCGQTFIKKDFKTYSGVVNRKIYGS